MHGSFAIFNISMWWKVWKVFGKWTQALCGEAIQSGSQLNGLVEKKNATLLENKPGVGKEREATDWTAIGKTEKKENQGQEPAQSH